MSTNPIWTTHCDSSPNSRDYPQSEKCPGWCAQEDTKAAARSSAVRRGWALGSGDLPDLCPACTPASWCPLCGAKGTEHCSTASGRDHRPRALLTIRTMETRTALAAEARKGADQ